MSRESGFDPKFFYIGPPAIFRVNVIYRSHRMSRVNGTAIGQPFRKYSLHLCPEVNTKILWVESQHLGVESLENPCQGTHMLKELSLLETTGLDLLGSKFNKAGANITMVIAAQLTMAQPVSKISPDKCSPGQS